jgi:hypothetical protein
LASAATEHLVARLCRRSERTVTRRWAEPAFRQRLQQLRADRVQRTAGALTAADTEAVRTLLELQKPPMPPAVRLGAARTVREIGVKLREAAELEERIAELERRSQAQQPRPYRS